MKKTYLLVVLLLVASYSFSQVTIAYTSFEDVDLTGVSGNYTDSGDATTAHDMFNNPLPQPPVDTPNGATEMGMDARYFPYNNPSTGMTDGDIVGVSNLLSDVGAFTDGTQGYKFSDTDGTFELYSEVIDLTGYDNVVFTMDYFINSTTYEGDGTNNELTDDRMSIYIVSPGPIPNRDTNGIPSVVILETFGTDINDLGIEGVWQSASVNIDPTWENIQVYITVQTNSNSETLYIDNIKIEGDENITPSFNCGDRFTDPGEDGNYDNNFDQTVTIFPEDSSNPVSLTFYDFITESGADILAIYSGTSTSDPLLATLTGDLSGSAPFTFTSSDISGALTLRFVTNASVTAEGWVALISCGGVPSDNVTCELATTVTCGETITGDTTHTFLTGDLSDCGGYDGTSASFGVWYTFVGTGEEVVLSTCSVNSNYDTQLVVLSGDCNSLVCVDGNDDDSSCTDDLLSTVSFLSNIGETYYIYVTGYDEVEFGNYELSVECFGLSTNDLINYNFNYFPNPVSDILTLSASENINEVIIYDILGQQVLKSAKSLRNLTLDLSSFSTGTYFVKVKINNTVESFKIIKK